MHLKKSSLKPNSGLSAARPLDNDWNKRWLMLSVSLHFWKSVHSLNRPNEGKRQTTTKNTKNGLSRLKKRNSCNPSRLSQGNEVVWQIFTNTAFPVKRCLWQCVHPLLWLLYSTVSLRPLFLWTEKLLQTPTRRGDFQSSQTDDSNAANHLSFQRATDFLRLKRL